jgi:methylated-DNA-protein-cysteine methyltransferase-like protein
MKQSGKFTREVWRLAQSIPPGRVTTYALLAVSAGGHPMLSRLITSVFSKCPDQDSIPYHRIVYSDGKVWLDPNCTQERLKLYAREGIKLDKNHRIVNFNELVFTF